MSEHYEILKQDCMDSFAAALKDLQPIIKDGTKVRLVDTLHKLRTRCLQLISEARDA